jgi:hypothetical protein
MQTEKIGKRFETGCFETGRFETWRFETWRFVGVPSEHIPTQRASLTLISQWILQLVNCLSGPFKNVGFRIWNLDKGSCFYNAAIQCCYRFEILWILSAIIALISVYNMCCPPPPPFRHHYNENNLVISCVARLYGSLGENRTIRFFPGYPSSPCHACP